MDVLPQQFINGIVLGSSYAIIAVGYALVFGCLRVVNLSHGDTGMMGAFIGLLCTHYFDSNIFLAIFTAAAAAGVLGWIIERVAIRPLGQVSDSTEASHFAVIITTVGVSIFLQNLALKVFGGYPQPFPSLIPHLTYNFGPIHLTSVQVTVFIGATILMVGLHLLVNWTKLGMAIRATAENPESAAMVGINIKSIQSLTMALASALGGAASVLCCMLFGNISPFIGTQLGFKGLVALIVGGVGNIVGALLCGLSLGIIETLSAGYISSSFRDGIAFLLLTLVLILKPSGLLGVNIHKR